MVGKRRSKKYTRTFNERYFALDSMPIAEQWWGDGLIVDKNSRDKQPKNKLHRYFRRFYEGVCDKSRVLLTGQIPDKANLKRKLKISAPWSWL